jgi:hypothetical protein
LPAVRSIFVRLSLAEAEKAIALYDLKRFGLELIPIPAAGGCVIAIRELPHSETRFLKVHLPWLDWVKQARAEIELRSVLRTLTLASATGDA